MDAHGAKPAATEADRETFRNKLRHDNGNLHHWWDQLQARKDLIP
jgi:hypothetical protein